MGGITGTWTVSTFTCGITGAGRFASFDSLVFSNIDKLAKRLNPTTLVISEVVFGILLTAVAVQLAVAGLADLGIISAQGAAH